jgi:hypothetical protein
LRLRQGNTCEKHKYEYSRYGAEGSRQTTPGLKGYPTISLP